MRKHLLSFLIISILLLSFEKVIAQSRLGVYIGGGSTWYYGDMNDRILTHPKLFRYYINGGLSYRLLPRLDVNANILYGKIVGADSLAIQDFNRRRGLNFQSNIFEASLILDYHLLRGTRILNPYLILGAGYLKFNPQTIYKGEKIDLQPLGTEGQYINGTGYPQPYKLYTLSFPLGLGVEIPISNALYVRLEYESHFTLTDYLDDVSTRFADSTRLANTQAGPLAAAVANNTDRKYPNEGYGRGNPKQRDTYSTFGVSILYRFVSGGGNTNSGGRNKGVIGKKKKNKTICPAYK